MKSIRTMLLPIIIGTIAVAGVAGGSAASPASEAGPGASPKVIACMAACEQTQMTCLQGPSSVPPQARTIKDINTFRACNRTEEVCDHRCRKVK
jgi:hypothetical protein